jgi:flagellar biosynthesis protein FlhG
MPSDIQPEPLSVFSRLLRASGVQSRRPGRGRERQPEERGPARAGRVICVASGKGGTGKSFMATNLAAMRAKAGERVLLIDFDAGMANAHLMLGLNPKYDLGDVMARRVSVEDALVEGSSGLQLLSGGVGRRDLAQPTRRELDRLFDLLSLQEERFDLIVIDHGAGLGYGTLTQLAATRCLLLVTNPEVTALSDAYALYKQVLAVNDHLRVGLVVNRAPDETVALDAWGRFRGVSKRFLQRSPEYLGWVPADRAVYDSVQQRSPVCLAAPESASARSLRALASWQAITAAPTGGSFFTRARKALR